MQLSNSFTIARPVAEVFDAFLDIDRIATCMPGSTLLGQSGDHTYDGEVKVKVGPLSVAYTGTRSPCGSRAGKGAAPASAGEAQGAGAQPAPQHEAVRAPAAEAAVGDGLDAWSLIIRPMMQRLAGSIATVAMSEVAAYVGARRGARAGRLSPTPPLIRTRNGLYKVP
jgi:hypothetical protein